MPPGRPMQWFDTETPFGGLAGNAQANLLLYNVTFQASASVKGATITRMIIDLRLQAGSVAQLTEVYWGIILVNADARAAGAFPDADDMSETAGWLARGRMMVVQSDLSDRSQWDEVHMDLRSQRVLRNEKDELHLILDNGSASFTANWAAMIRVLVKLP